MHCNKKCLERYKEEKEFLKDPGEDRISRSRSRSPLELSSKSDSESDPTIKTLHSSISGVLSNKSPSLFDEPLKSSHSSRSRSPEIDKSNYNTFSNQECSSSAQLESLYQIPTSPTLLWNQINPIFLRYNYFMDNPIVTNISHVRGHIFPELNHSTSENKQGAIDAKTQGMLFGGLKQIPNDPSVDPPPRVCFNCWGSGHNRKKCPCPILTNFCFNCGRREVNMVNCPRCSEAHIRWNIIRTWKKINPIFQINNIEKPPIPAPHYSAPPRLVPKRLVREKQADTNSETTRQLELLASLAPEAQVMALKFLLNQNPTEDQ